MARRDRNAFTLLEILLVVALFGILAGMSIPFYQSYQQRNDVDIAQDTIAQSARRAQTLARAGDGESSWGIYVQSGSVTIFQGADYATRNTNADEVVPISSAISVSGDAEIVFNAITGFVNTDMTVTVSHATGGSESISINTLGTVILQ